MTVNFKLNGDDETVRTDAERRLVEVLRDTFGLIGTKSGCLTGNCGACSVILNSDVVKACLIPIFKVREREIITIEGFSTYDEYQDIILSFDEAGVELCGFCDAGKILTVYALLEKNSRPGREEILAAFQGIKCRCTEPEGLVRAVTLASERRRVRRYGRSS